MSSKKLRSGILGPLGGQTGHWMLDLVFFKRKLQRDSFYRVFVISVVKPSGV